MNVVVHLKCGFNSFFNVKKKMALKFVRFYSARSMKITLLSMGNAERHVS